MHLKASSPATNLAFINFLEQASEQASALLLIGDIFDAWIGDDYAIQTPPNWLKPVIKALQQCAQTVDLYLMRGNRDFLMGNDLARHLGATMLPDALKLETDYGCIIVSHGDEYCTADTSYQRFKRITRNKAVQNIFLNLSLHTRIKIAQYARNRSKQSYKNKTNAIMDVTERAITNAFINNNCTTMVHGHTHRPAIHTHAAGNNSCTRIVLSDWDFDSNNPRATWLSISKHGFKVISHPDLNQR